MRKILFFLFLICSTMFSKAAVVTQTINQVIPYGIGASYTLNMSGSSIDISYDVFSGVYFMSSTFNNEIGTLNAANWDQLVLHGVGDVIDVNHLFNGDGSTTWGSGPGQYNPGLEPAGTYYIGLYTANGNYGYAKITIIPGIQISVDEACYESTVGAGITTGNSSSSVLVTNITVNSAGNASTVNTGGTLQMSAIVLPINATNNTVTWSVQNGTGTATISAGGLLTGVSAGTVIVKATANDGSGVVGVKTITVNVPAVLVNNIIVNSAGNATSVNMNATLQMSAVVLPANANNNTVSWSVQNGTGTATINANGLLTGLTAGIVTVIATANDGSGVTGSKQITIIDPTIYVTAITVSSAGNVNTVNAGSNIQMSASVLPTNATNNSVTWTVINGVGSATISAGGVLTGVTPGTVTVKATANDGTGISGTKVMIIQSPTVLITSITVQSAGNATSVTTGNSLQMSALVLPTNAANTSVTWSVVNNSGTASISAGGLLTGLTAGTVTVKATANDGSGIAATKTITVVNPLGITPLPNDAHFSVYTNQQTLFITYSSAVSEQTKYHIYTISGQLVASGKITETIDISGLVSGMYIINFVGPQQEKQVIKFSK